MTWRSAGNARAGRVRDRGRGSVHLGHRAGAQRGGVHRRHAGATAGPGLRPATASRSWSPTAARPTAPATIVGGAATAATRNLRLLDNPGRLSSAGRNVAVAAPRGDDRPADRRPLRSGQSALSRRPGRRLRPQRRRLRGPAAAAGRDRRDAAAAGHRRGPGVAAGPSSRPRTSTPTARASCRRRAWPSPIAARCSSRSACSTRRSTPARTWSSTTASPGPACAASSRRACGCAITRGRTLGRPVPADGALRPRPGAAAAQASGHVLAAGLRAGGVPGGVLARAAVRRLCHLAAGWLYAGVLGLYALAVLLFSVALRVRRRDAALLPLLPLVFATIHAGAGWGVWCGGCRRPEAGRARPSANCRRRRLSRAASTRRFRHVRRLHLEPTRHDVTVRHRRPDAQRPDHRRGGLLPRLRLRALRRRGAVGRLRARASPTARTRLLDISPRPACAARSSCSAGWRSGSRSWSRRIHAAGHEIGCHGYWPPAHLRRRRRTSSAPTCGVAATCCKTSSARR